MTNGYPDRPLADKLGLKPGMSIAVLRTPPDYEQLIGNWPVGVSVSRQLNQPTFDFIHYFVKNASTLRAVFPNLTRHLAKTGMLWISWPKGASGWTTDLSENLVRQIGLEGSLVDVKVVAVDANWSGLKFVHRVKNR